MNFKQACDAMKQGKSVTRHKWNYPMKLAPMNSHDEQIIIYDEGEEFNKFPLSIQDIEATDYEIAKEGKEQPKQDEEPGRKQLFDLLKSMLESKVGSSAIAECKAQMFEEAKREGHFFMDFKSAVQAMNGGAKVKRPHHKHGCFLVPMFDGEEIRFNDSENEGRGKVLGIGPEDIDAKDWYVCGKR